MSEVPADPWAAATPAPRPQGFDGQAVFEDAFRAAVEDTAALQAIAWAALVQRFGSATALQLAPVLLPPLIEAAIREAAASTRQAAQEWSTQQVLQQFPVIPTGQPW